MIIWYNFESNYLINCTLRFHYYLGPIFYSVHSLIRWKSLSFAFDRASGDLVSNKERSLPHLDVDRSTFYLSLNWIPSNSFIQFLSLQRLTHFPILNQLSTFKGSSLKRKLLLHKWLFSLSLFNKRFSITNVQPF